jgi:hypothetical protein
MSDIQASRLLSLLTDIERAIVELSSKPAIREVGSQVASGGAFGSKPPGDLRVLDLLIPGSNQAIVPMLLSWAVMIRDERTDAGLDDAGPSDADLATLCTYLRQRVGFVVTQSWANELHDAWTSARGVLAAMPGSPLHREVIQRTACIAVIHDVKSGRNCAGVVETRVTGNHDGTATVTSRCRTCGTVYDDAALAAAVQRQDDELMARAEWITADEAVAMGVLHDKPIGLRQIEYWAAVHHIARGEKRDGKRTYSALQIMEQAGIARHAA